MGNYKKINAFSLTPVDIKHIVGDLNNIFFNDSIIVVPKASPRSENFLREGEIYHLVEPRIVTVLQGSGDIYINLEEYHIEKGTVITAGPDMILEVVRCAGICNYLPRRNQYRQRNSSGYNRRRVGPDTKNDIFNMGHCSSDSIPQCHNKPSLKSNLKRNRIYKKE